MDASSNDDRQSSTSSEESPSPGPSPLRPALRSLSCPSTTLQAKSSSPTSFAISGTLSGFKQKQKSRSRIGTVSILENASLNTSIRPPQLEISGPLFETSVVSSVKLKGFLNVRPGDIVTVLDIEGGSQGMAYVQLGEEVGKVPMAALLIDHHCYNIHLQANIKIIARSPSLLHFACTMDESMAERLVDILCTRPGALVRALSTLVAIEVEDKKLHQLETETLRADSAALRMLSAVLRRPAVLSLERKVTDDAVVAIGSRHVPSSEVASVQSFLSVIVPKLRQILESPIPELVVVIQALQNGGAAHLVVSFLCLRCFVPPLAQASIAGAKALQVLANDFPLSENSGLYPIRNQLKDFRSSLEQAVTMAAQKVAELPRPTKSLVRSSIELYAKLLQGYQWCLLESRDRSDSFFQHVGTEQVSEARKFSLDGALVRRSKQSEVLVRKSLELWQSPLRDYPENSVSDIFESTGPVPSGEDLAQAMTQSKIIENANMILHQAIIPLLMFTNDDLEPRAVFRGVALMAFKFLSHPDGDQELFRMMQEYVEKNRKMAPKVLEFVTLWISIGREMSNTVLEEIKTWVATLPNCTSSTTCLDALEKDLNFFSPVLGRWSTQLTPCSNVLAWMDWSNERIAVALTSMCLPFFSLRASEFDEKRPGKHLKDLNVRHRVVSQFVVFSILKALTTSKHLGVKCAERWLEVAMYLAKLRNFHMLFALQNSFQKHQLDRLGDLWSSLSRKDLKKKQYLADMFRAEDKMAMLLVEQKKCLGKEPMIPCIFWLVQKATLLVESPLFLSDEAINVKHFSAASNIFEDMLRCQALPYKQQELIEDEVLWYFLHLERAPMVSDDALYELSDQAKEVLRGKSVKDMFKAQKRTSGATLAPSMSSGSRDSSSSVSPSEDTSHIPPHRPLHKSDPGTGSSDSQVHMASFKASSQSCEVNPPTAWSPRAPNEMDQEPNLETDAFL